MSKSKDLSKAIAYVEELMDEYAARPNYDEVRPEEVLEEVLNHLNLIAEGAV